MAELATTEVPETMTETATTKEEDMELDTNPKRARDDESGEPDSDPKKQKTEEKEKSAEEERAEKGESGRVSLGPKSFGSSVEMFDYFFKLIHHWPINLNLNKYEHMVLLELLEKGHLEPEKKIGDGVDVFQIRVHPKYNSKCFFIVRSDESVDDFSFRKCVDHILPLPENMQIKHEVNKKLGGRDSGRGGKGGRGRGHFRGGRGRGGKPRN